MNTDLYKDIPASDLPRITRQQFCDHMEMILDKIVADGIPYLVTQEGGPDFLVTPASWYGIISNSDLRTLVVCAVRYALGRQTFMPSMIDDIVRRCMDRLEESTLSIIARDIDEELQMHANMYDAAIWAKLRDDIWAQIKRNS